MNEYEKKWEDISKVTELYLIQVGMGGGSTFI